MPITLQAPPPAYELQPYKSLENDELTARIQAIRKRLEPQLLILGHHYQQDEVIALWIRAATAMASANMRPKAAIAVTSYFAASISWPKRPTSWPTVLKSSAAPW